MSGREPSRAASIELEEHAVAALQIGRKEELLMAGWIDFASGFGWIRAKEAAILGDAVAADGDFAKAQLCVDDAARLQRNIARH